jgi:P27 family predicted phage terminase small subunit
MTKLKKLTPPKHLSAEAKRLWDRLRNDYVLDDSGGLLLLQSALESFDRLQQARAILAKEGIVAKDRFGQGKPHAAAAVEAGARQQMHSALRLLRLEPGALGGDDD